MSGQDEVTMVIPYYADSVGLNTDDVKRPINMLDDLLKYLVTVKKRWGNTAVTCNMQWGASALWIRSEQAEKIAALEAQLTSAAKRVEELEGANLELNDRLQGAAKLLETAEKACKIWIEKAKARHEQIEHLESQVDSLTSQLAALRAVAGELVQAMVDYEMDVDNSPPRKHRDMMQRAREALATTTNGEGER